MAKFKNLANNNSYRIAFFAGVLGGCCGILPDADHPLALVLGIEYPRFLHYWFLLGACSIIVCCCAYLARLLLVSVLKK